MAPRTTEPRATEPRATQSRATEPRPDESRTAESRRDGAGCNQVRACAGECVCARADEPRAESVAGHLQPLRQPGERAAARDRSAGGGGAPRGDAASWPSGEGTGSGAAPRPRPPASHPRSAGTIPWSEQPAQPRREAHHGSGGSLGGAARGGAAVGAGTAAGRRADAAAAGVAARDRPAAADLLNDASECPESEIRLHSGAPAARSLRCSSLTYLRVCALLAPCDRAAVTPSVRRRISDSGH